MIWEGIHQLIARLAPPARLINSTGRPRSWDQTIRRTQVVCSSLTSTSPRTTHSSHLKCPSRPKFTILTSTRTAPSVSTSWKTSGRPLSQSPKCSSPLAPSWPTPTQMILSCQRSPPSTRTTKSATMLRLATGLEDMQRDLATQLLMQAIRTARQPQPTALSYRAASARSESPFNELTNSSVWCFLILLEAPCLNALILDSFSSLFRTDFYMKAR